jgi:hypothetical protein
MAPTSGNATRRSRSAELRRQTYQDRCDKAGGERKKIHALVWWWMAEIYRLSPTRRATEVDRLKAITTELNEGGAT